MSRVFSDNPILKRFRAALDMAYGSRLERVVLYGSRARGEAGPDSDYNIAVFLRDMPDRATELNRLADLGSDFLSDTGEFVPQSSAFLAKSRELRERAPALLANGFPDEAARAATSPAFMRPRR